MDTPEPPPIPPPSASPGPEQPAHDIRWWQKPLVIALIGFTGFVIGAVAGAGAGGTGDDGQTTAEPETVTEYVTEYVTVLVTPTESSVVPEAPATTEPESPAEEPTGDPRAPDAFQTGSYSFASIDIRSDFVDDFEAVARVTNNGSTVDTVAFTMTIFNGSRIVATLSGSLSDFDAGSTRTIEFTGLDDYTSGWDSFDIQVDFEF